jgi:hypothetical protein
MSSMAGVKFIEVLDPVPSQKVPSKPSKSGFFEPFLDGFYAAF